MGKNIFDQVYRITKLIPKGQVATYGEIARELGINPRVVGWALHANKNPNIPCHRVVDRNGRIAKNYSFEGEEEQRRRLLAEGIKFKDKNHVLFTFLLVRKK